MVRFSKTETPILDLRNKIRHIYDIHQMLEDEKMFIFFNSPDFDNILTKVGDDDVISFKNNNGWLSDHPSTAIIFANPDETWQQIKTEYFTTFKGLVTGNLPSESQLIHTLKTVAKRLAGVEWKVRQ